MIAIASQKTENKLVDTQAMKSFFLTSYKYVPSHGRTTEV